MADKLFRFVIEKDRVLVMTIGNFGRIFCQNCGEEVESSASSIAKILRKSLAHTKRHEEASQVRSDSRIARVFDWLLRR